MSLYGALFSGVSGLAAQSSAMAAISDNITNVNTVGYKSTKVNFSTLVTKQVSLTSYSPGGVQSRPRAGIDNQGLLQATNSSTDIALAGQGFMVVNKSAHSDEGGMFAYTRAGSFKADREGFLQNVSGWYMQGWPLMSTSSATPPPGASLVDVAGNTFMKAYKNETGQTVLINDNVVSPVHLQPLNLTRIGGTAAQTRNLSMAANLPAAAKVGDSFNQPLTIYDSLGTDANLQFTWTKNDTNAWDLRGYPPAGARSMSLVQRPQPPGAVNSAAARLDFLGMPKSGGKLNLTLGASSSTVSPNWTFDLDAATDGATANHMSTQAGNGSVGEFVNNLATDINTAYRITLESVEIPLTAGGAAGKKLVMTGSNGLPVTIDTATASTAIALAQEINKYSTDTGVEAFVNGGKVYACATDARTVTIADETAAPIGTPVLGGAVGTLVGTGKAYCEAVGGSNALVFRQDYAMAGDLVVAGLNSTLTLANGNPATQQGMDKIGDADTFSVKALDNEYSAIEFNGDGTPKKINIAAIEIDWANGSNDMNGAADSIGFFLGNEGVDGGMGQKEGPYQLGYWNQNGAKFGNFAGVSVGADGIVTALFDNGVTRAVFQIPVATFTNPNGMNSLSGNVFLSTDNSGEPTLRTAGAAGAASTASASLEASTVDIGEEFTTMIVTQRAYSAAAKIITTADEMLDELVRIKR